MSTKTIDQVKAAKLSELKRLLATGDQQIARGEFSTKSALDIADEVIGDAEKLDLLKARFASIDEEKRNGELVDGETFFRLLDACDACTDEETRALLELIAASERSGEASLIDLDEAFEVAERSGVTLSLLEAFYADKVLVRVRPWFASETGALRWYLNERLPSFGHLTPVEVVKQYGEQGVKELLEYAQAKKLGGFE